MKTTPLFLLAVSVALLPGPFPLKSQDLPVTDRPATAIPAAPPAGAPANLTTNQIFDPTTLEGEHRCRGRNPDDTNYQGSVQIRMKDGLVLMEWDINGKKSYGTALLQGTALGVGLDNGVAIYQIVPQPGGASLVGLWATEDAKSACEEVILIGESDATTAKFPVLSINGAYRAVTTRPDGTSEETPFSISGKDTLKHVKLKDGTLAQGLLLGSGFALITPTGLSMFQIGKDDAGQQCLTGRSLDQTTISNVSLIPYQ